VLRMLIEKKGKDFNEFIAKMKEVIKISMMSARRRINRMERDNCFEIFGYDFMVDDLDCRPWLIEVNTNPCIE
jgi:tubulin---tyrosine ligase